MDFREWMWVLVENKCQGCIVAVDGDTFTIRLYRDTGEVTATRQQLESWNTAAGLKSLNAVSSSGRNYS